MLIENIYKHGKQNVNMLLISAYSSSFLNKLIACFFLISFFGTILFGGLIPHSTFAQGYIDADGDGIPDDQQTGTSTDTGTTDADGDGIPDDQTTDTSTDTGTTDADGDGIPDDQTTDTSTDTGISTDADGDGIPDDQTTGTSTDTGT